VSQQGQPSDSGTSKPKPQDPPPEPQKPTLPEGDSFWTACAYSVEGERIPLPNEDWWADLTLWADGTARLRQVEDELIIYDEHALRMTWTVEENGDIVFKCPYSGDDPYYVGKLTEDGMELTQDGSTFYLEEAPMPREAGELYCPAELRGVWLQVSSEIDGYRENTMPGHFNSLVLTLEWDEKSGQDVLKAASEQGDCTGFVPGDTYFSYSVEVLEEPVYEGCGNESWSVRIGPTSPLNENGYPKDVERYATLLDRDTVLFQRYFSIDGGPAVSYQTYKRVIPYSPGWQMENEEITGSWACTGYRNEAGEELAAPAGLEGFQLRLSDDRRFIYRTDAGEDGVGRWILGEGNTLLLYNDNDYDALDDWFAGAAGMRKVVTAEYESEIYEICLWYDGGLMQLERQEDTGQWDDYVDTMTDIEGRAFAAPENTLFVLYNQNYGDFADYDMFRTYTISDGPEAQYLLVTSVIDGNYFWLEEDGYCREDFGTLDAGESIVIRLDIPESGGMNLQVESKLGDYYYELTRDRLVFNENWNYITT